MMPLPLKSLAHRAAWLAGCGAVVSLAGTGPAAVAGPAIDLFEASVAAADHGAVSGETIAPASPVLDSVEKSLLGIFGNDVKVEASNKTVDRAGILERCLRPGTLDYLQFSSDSSGGKPLRITTASSNRLPGRWPADMKSPTVMTIPGNSTSWLVRRDSTLVMPTQIDQTQSVLVRYDPPEVRVFAGTTPGPVDMGVKVYDVHGTGSPEHAGSLRVTATDRGVRRVTTPAGTFDAVMYRFDYKGTIGPASIEDSELFFACPENGIVASVERKKVSAMIFYNTDTRFAYALVGPGKPGGK